MPLINQFSNTYTNGNLLWSIFDFHNFSFIGYLTFASYPLTESSLDKAK